VLDPRVVPGDLVLIGVGRVVLLGHVVTEEKIAQGLEAVGVPARDVHGDEVVLADVGRKRLPGLAVEDDNARRPLQTGEEVVLAPFVVVQAADDALAREGEVRLHHVLRQLAVPAQLGEPSTLVLEARQRDDLDPREGHGLLAPFARTKSLTA
jgi:hypothetical protein